MMINTFPYFLDLFHMYNPAYISPIIRLVFLYVLPAIHSAAQRATSVGLMVRKLVNKNSLVNERIKKNFSSEKFVSHLLSLGGYACCQKACDRTITVAVQFPSFTGFGAFDYFI